MSKRAEEAALKAYPEEMTRIPYQDLIEANGGKEYVDFNSMPRGYFQFGYEQAEKDLGWHSVDESLPPVDEEVIVLRNESNGITLPYPYNLTYGHLVADKTIFVEYNGWNVPGVKYWMPMPKIPNEDE